MKFDLIVIGSGPGGYVAAIRAAQLAMKTAIVEREHLGGICLNWGCIPTKALLRSAEVYDLFRRASEFGLAADNLRFDAKAVVRRSRDVLIVGSGAIGIEFASFYRTMGAKVTVVEMLDEILPAEDGEIAANARKQFEKQGIAILTSAKVSGVRRTGGGDLAATIERGDRSEQVSAQKIIVAVGVQGNVESLGLEGLGVSMDRGCIAIDAFGRTNVPGLYAIGDVAGAPMLAHKAEHEGAACVEAIAGLKPHPLKRETIPGCTYSHPQVASVGLTEAKARAAGRELRIGRFPFAANGKAIALGEDRGLVKTIFETRSGKLIGAHLVGPEVTELIQGFVIAMGLETTEQELFQTVFPHPTLSEAMHESVLAAYGQAIHS